MKIRELTQEFNENRDLEKIPLFVKQLVEETTRLTRSHRISDIIEARSTEKTTTYEYESLKIIRQMLTSSNSSNIDVMFDLDIKFGTLEQRNILRSSKKSTLETELQSLFRNHPIIRVFKTISILETIIHKG